MSAGKLCIILSLVFFVCGSVFAAGTADEGKLKLIPKPQRVALAGGGFKIQKTTPIILANQKDTNDIFAAEQLKEEIQQQFGFTLEIVEKASKPFILIGQLGRDKDIDEAVKKLKISLDANLGGDSYLLSITKKQILVAGKDSAGTFYGVQTLKQIIRGSSKADAVPCCLIQDWPALKFRGWWEDVTRGPIPKMESLKRKIRTMAEYKENMLSMYTEHVFKLKKHPLLAPPDGLTAEEVRELSDYAKKYHVDLVGCFQSLAHTWNILKHPEYAHLKETTDIITPAKEETYQFLKDVYSEIVPAYSSKYFHVCGDEAGALGTGPAKQMAKEMGKGGLYVYHFNRINEMLKPYGKTMMMWCDMMGHYPNDLKKLPADAIIIPWSYETWKNKDYERLIKPVVESGHQFMVCCGIMNWSRMWPDIDGAIKNNAMWTRDCFKNKGLGIFNTSWLDAGEELYPYNWYPFIWGAECAWKPVMSEGDKDYDAILKEHVSKFQKAFDPLFYGSKEGTATKAITEIEDLRRYSSSVDEGDWIRLSNRVFWNDPFEKLDYTIKDDADKDPSEMLDGAQKIISLLEEAKKTTRFNADTLDYAVFAAKRVSFVAKRKLACNAFVRYKRDGKGTLEQVQKDLNMLTDELTSLRTEYVRLWNQENRESWRENVLEKYDTMISSLKNRDIKVVMPNVDISVDPMAIELSTYLGIGDIYYTKDGAEPNKSGIRYVGPFVVPSTTVVKAIAYYQGRSSAVYQKQFTKMDNNDCIFYRYYETKNPCLWGKLPDFTLLNPVKTGNTRDFDISLRNQEDFYAFNFSGFVDITKEGEYTFYVKSDDGSKLFIDGEELVNNDGLHGSVEKSRKVLLKPGKHVIIVQQFNGNGYMDLEVSYEGPDIKKQAVKCCK